MINKTAATMIAVATLAAASSGAVAAPQIQNGFYQESISTSCAGSTVCVGSFTAVPAGKTLVVRQIECRGIVPGNAQVYGTALHSFGAGISGKSYLTGKVEKAINPAGAFAYTYSQEAVNMFSGTTPRVTMYATVAPATFNLQCTISGTYS